MSQTTVNNTEFNESDVYYPPGHEKFNENKWIEIIETVGGKEEREENWKKLIDYRMKKQQNEDNQQSLNLQEQTKIIANKIYFTAMRNNSRGTKLLEFFKEHKFNLKEYHLDTLLEMPGVKTWYDEQNDHVKSSWKYWRSAIQTKLTNALDKMGEKIRRDQK